MFETPVLRRRRLSKAFSKANELKNNNPPLHKAENLELNSKAFKWLAVQKIKAISKNGSKAALTHSV